MLAFLGDGSSNMSQSYLLGGATAGMRVRIGAPGTVVPDPEIVAAATRIGERTGGGVEICTDPAAACEQADVIATDVWASMGQEAMARAPRGPGAVPPGQREAGAGQARLPGPALPAGDRGEEIGAEAIDGPNSVGWDQAENRLHAQKAILTWLLEQP